MIGALIRRPIAVSMAYVALALLGVAAWRNIPLELLPDTELPRLYVRADWPGASPEITEALVTSPLEAAVQQVRGVEEVGSVSQDENGLGVSRIEVRFARGTDMDFARLELGERLAATRDDLPDGVAGPWVEAYVPEEFSREDRAFLRYTVTGPYTLEALRAHLDDVVAPELRRVRGVADIEPLGGRERMLEIELDEEQILALRLPPELVRRRVLELEYVQEAGVVLDPSGRRRALAIRHRAESVADLLALPVLTDRGRVLRLADVATVRETQEDPFAYYRVDGRPAVAFVVHREIGTNAVAVADRTKARVVELAAAHPAGVRLILDQDQSEAIRAQLGDLRLRAVIAALVIFAVLLLFLGSFRSTAILFATIGFSVLITLNLLYWTGLTLNVLTLMGLATGFGLIVDNAIVVLENVYRRRRGGEAALAAAERGAREVVLPVVAATLTTVVVLFPFVYLQGELRDYYVPLALAVAFALLASLAVAFTFIPAVASRVLAGAGTPRPAAGRPPLYRRAYAAMVGGTLRHPWPVVVATALLLGGSWYLFDRHVDRGVLWGRWWGDDTYVLISIQQPRGEELDRTDELARYFEARLREMPEVERFVSNVYPRMARIEVSFPDSLDLTGVPVAVKDQLVAYSHLFGGAEVRVYGYGPSFYGGAGSPPTYSVRVLGYNYPEVRRIADDVGSRLRGFARIRDVDTNATGSFFDRDRATELFLRLDRRRLALHGLSARDAVRYVAAAVRGRAGGSRIRLAGEEMLFEVKLEGARVLDLQELNDLLLPNGEGQPVWLGDVATIEERPVLGRIVREDQQYQRLVSYEFRGPAKLGDLVHDAVIASTDVAPGYAVEPAESWSWSDDERRQVFGVLAVALILIYMVTAGLFESLRQPLCVLLSVPMALIGVFLLFFYTGASFTREAYVGAVMMAGIVVNNAILLVDHINARRRVDGLPLRDAIIAGTVERVRPILMTSATTIFGLLPLVAFSGAADARIWNALGYALIGGLASSTLLVLTVTPALYLLFERRADARRSPAAPAAA